MSFGQNWNQAIASIFRVVGRFKAPNQRLQSAVARAGLFKGPNFMTPDVIKIFSVTGKNDYIEVSLGTGMRQNYIVGVTVATRNRETGKFNYVEELNMCCTSYQEFVDHIEHLEKLFSED